MNRPLSRRCAGVTTSSSPRRAKDAGCWSTTTAVTSGPEKSRWKRFIALRATARMRTVAIARLVTGS